MDKPPISEYLRTIYAKVGPGIELDKLADVDYVLEKCNQCTLIYQRHIPDDELMLTLYEQWIDPETTRNNHLRSDDVSLFNYYASEISTILELIGKVPNDTKVLDFGMGWGKWALMAKAFGVHSMGAELSEMRIKNAQSLGIEIVHWDNIPGANFDFINTEQVFEHIGDPAETLAHLRKGLSDTGLIKFSVPTDNNIDRKLSTMEWTTARHSKNDLNAVSPLEHINLYNHQSLQHLAERCDLKLKTIPITLQLRYSSNWQNLKACARNLALPFYRNWLKKQNYVLLVPK